jgi:histidyl-tRNA synthetase
MTTRYQAIRGMRDILPDEVGLWHFLESTARRIFAAYGFREIRTPLIERTELFARSVGASSDLVRKEMYTFDRGDESMTLRPENTASVVRAFVEHSLHRGIAVGYPERYYYIGPMFRHERPQRGRQRQFPQIGVEVIGAHEPLADAETIHGRRRRVPAAVPAAAQGMARAAPRPPVRRLSAAIRRKPAPRP